MFAILLERNTFSCKNSFLGLHFDIVLGFPSEYIFRVMLLSNFQFHLSSHSMPWNLVFVFVVQISPNQVIVSNSFPFPWQYFSLLSCDTLCIRAAFILLSMTKSILLWMVNAYNIILRIVFQRRYQLIMQQKKSLDLVKKC